MPPVGDGVAAGAEAAEDETTAVGVVVADGAASVAG
jgi:hypothetical protein